MSDISMIWCENQAEIAKIVHSYLERGIGCEYDRFNSPPPPIYIGPVKIESLKERLEETKMEPTSVWKIEGIDKIWITQNGDEISLLLKNKDDLTKIILTGDAIKNHNDQFVTTLKADIDEGLRKKDQKIKELEEEVNHWKKEASDCLKLRDDAQKEAYKLKKENEKYEEKIKKLEHDDMLDKDAADYWSKEHDILLERFAKLQVENENLMGRIKELEALKTPTIENFADEEGKYVCLNGVPYYAEDIRRFKDTINELEEKDSIRQRAYDILDKTLKNLQRNCNKDSADNVNHPSHYTGRYECIDVMQDVFGDEATDNFCLCNAFKYIWRARKKNGLEDVRKAVWYLNKYIEEAEKDGVRKGE